MDDDSQEAIEMQQYLSVGDAAKALGVVPATVKQMVRSGRLAPAATTVGGLKLFSPEDVATLAEARSRKETYGATPAWSGRSEAGHG